MKSIRNICTEITVLKLLPHPPRDQWVKQLSKLNYAVITLSKTLDIPQSNITRYWIQHKRKKAKTLFRLWTPERHLIARPKVRAMGRLSWVFPREAPWDIESDSLEKRPLGISKVRCVKLPDVLKWYVALKPPLCPVSSAWNRISIWGSLGLLTTTFPAHWSPHNLIKCLPVFLFEMSM